jgi:hypothetical protein
MWGLRKWTLAATAAVALLFATDQVGAVAASASIPMYVYTPTDQDRDELKACLNQHTPVADCLKNITARIWLDAMDQARRAQREGWPPDHPLQMVVMAREAANTCKLPDHPALILSEQRSPCLRAETQKIIDAIVISLADYIRILAIYK